MKTNNLTQGIAFREGGLYPKRRIGRVKTAHLPPELYQD
jgi:hypothetical protein